MTATNMTPPEVLAVMDAHSITAEIGEKSRCSMTKARAAVAALIDRNAEQDRLIAEITNAAADAAIKHRDSMVALIDRVKELEAKVNEYRLEYDNPAKDYVRRSLLRDQLFALARAEDNHG